MIDIRLPNINATTTQEQVGQMRSYIYQLAEQLNWALNTVNDAQTTGNTSNISLQRTEGGKESISPEETQAIWSQLKPLIIKSADIVKAYEETIKTDFNGIYVAESDFGTYKEETKTTIEANSKGVTDYYDKIQTITNPDGTGYIDTLNAYIKRGELGTYPQNSDKAGVTAVGIAVGEYKDDSIKNYAWFTSNRLSFFDENFNEVAYISSERLYINDAVFLGTVQFGGYKMDTSNGIAFTWIGG